MDKNVLCPVLQIYLSLVTFECNTTSDWLKPYGLANEKLRFIQIYTTLKKKTKIVFENGWWIWTWSDLKIFILSKLMDECNTILSAYTFYKHLG